MTADGYEKLREHYKDVNIDESKGKILEECPDLIPVTSRTRAPRCGHGRQIVCPYCSLIETVYHFSWVAVVCKNCGRTVQKTQFLTK